MGTEEEFRNVNVEKFVDLFYSEGKRRYLMGINIYSRSIAEKIDIEAYIDDFTTLEEVDGVKVVRSVDTPRDALVICCSIGVMPLSARLKLRENNLSFIDYYDFRKLCNFELEPIVYVDGFNEHYKKFKESFEIIRKSFADEESRVVLDRLISFRLEQNVDHLRGFFNLQHRQYFEYFIDLNTDSKLTFLDVGGFDGATTLEFLKCYGYEHEVFIFEPDEENYKKVKHNLKTFSNVNCLKYGASNHNEKLSFASAGSSSGKSDTSDVFVDVITIDSMMLDKVDYIKMDIEGMEPLALEGAQNTISRHKPYMAISVYHKPEHIYELWSQVMTYNPGYKTFMRHYTEGVTETVMYFVPEKIKKSGVLND